jgi:PHP family Zn ribbon phosphoesterase
MIIPDLNDMQESMSFNQIDVEQINTCFEEITHSKKEPTCTSCKQTLTPIVDKSHLLKCQKCSKFSLAKPNDFQTSVVILIGKSKCFINKNKSCKLAISF